MEDTSVPVESKVKNRKYNWLDIPSISDTKMASSVGGVIIMRPGLRDKLSSIGDENGLIFSQLLQSLTVAHSVDILHCDISPHNCIKFEDDGWQVIDYSLATEITDKVGNYVSYFGTTVLYKNSYQHKCCGYRVYEIVEAVQERTTIDWTISDDLEMLHNAFWKKSR